jgi:hypothetical protein
VLPHGRFLPWINKEFGMSDKTAERFINVAVQFSSKIDTVSNFNPTVLYLLAAPSTPDEVVEQVIEKAPALQTGCQSIRFCYRSWQ